MRLRIPDQCVLKFVLLIGLQLLAITWSAGVAEAATALTTGVPATFTLPSVTTATLFHGDYSFTITVPAGTPQLVIALTTSTVGGDVDLYARLGQDVDLSNGQVVRDFASETTSGNETITINAPAAGTYYIAFGLFSLNTAVTSTVTATYAGGTPANNLVLSQFVNGGGWTTALFLTNVSTTSENYTVRFYGTNGTLRLVPIVGANAVNTITGTLSPGQTVVYETGNSPGTVESGWTVITPGTVTANRLNGFAVYKFPGLGEAIVTPGNQNDQSLVLLYDQLSGFSTGVALVNPTNATLTFNITVRDQNGVTLQSGQIVLSALSQTAFFVPERFASAANRRGSLLITASSGFSALGLRFSPSGAFTSFPALK
jgi:hypothetical protein